MYVTRSQPDLLTSSHSRLPGSSPQVTSRAWPQEAASSMCTCIASSTVHLSPRCGAWRSQEKATPNKGSRYFSRACMRNRHKYGADGKKYQFKGGLVASPEASRPPDRRALSQRNRCPGARSFHGLVRRRSRCPRCSRAIRALAAGRSALASERPFSAPFSAPSYLYSHATAAQTLLL